MAASATSSELAKLCWSSSWPEVSIRMLEYTSELRSCDSNGIYPLHIAVWYKAPRGVIDEMVRMYPVAVSLKSAAGYFAVDYAKLFNNEDPSLIEALSPSEHAEIEQVGELETKRSTELHSLCHWKFGEAEERCEIYGEEAAFQDDDGNLALHLAVEHQA